MTEILMGFEGQRRDVDDLGFALFGQMLREGDTKEVPGSVTIKLKPLPLRKGVGHALIEVAVFIGQNVVIPLFVAWLCDKWKRAGEKPISIIIENRYCQFDERLMIDAIQGAVRGTEKLRKVLEDAPVSQGFLGEYVRELELLRHEEDIFLRYAFRNVTIGDSYSPRGGTFITSAVSELYGPLDDDQKREVREWWHQMVRQKASLYDDLLARLSSLQT